MAPEQRKEDHARMARMESDIKDINGNLGVIAGDIKSLTAGEQLWHETMCGPNRKQIGQHEHDIVKLQRKSDSLWPKLWTQLAGSVVTVLGVIIAVVTIMKSVPKG